MERKNMSLKITYKITNNGVCRKNSSLWIKVGHKELQELVKEVIVDTLKVC